MVTNGDKQLQDAAITAGKTALADLVTTKIDNIQAQLTDLNAQLKANEETFRTSMIARRTLSQTISEQTALIASLQSMQTELNTALEAGDSGASQETINP
jgi:chromosome segregation ATPase